MTIRLGRRRFVGYDGPEEFLEWSRHMAYYFSQRDYDEVEQCDIAIRCFVNYAWDWWCRVEDKRWERAMKPVETWKHLVYLMTRHFAPQVDPIAYATQSYRRTIPPASARVPDPARSPDPVQQPFLQLSEEQREIQELRRQLEEERQEKEIFRRAALLIAAPTVPEFNAPPTEQTIIMAPSEPTFHAVIEVQVLPGSCSIMSTEEPDDAHPPGTDSYFIKFEVPRVGPLPEVVYMLQTTRRLPLAPPSSKRGRFESKGRRMMHSSPDPNRVQARPSRPRPWRPPWKILEDERDDQDRNGGQYEDRVIQRASSFKYKIAFYMAIIQERVPRVLQQAHAFSLFNASFEQITISALMRGSIQIRL